MTPQTVMVPCGTCGQERPITVSRRWDLIQAERRSCFACGNGYTRQTIDEMAVERLIIGRHPVKVNAAERREAVAYLTRAGRSARVIAQQIGCTKRTVERHRATLAAQ